MSAEDQTWPEPYWWDGPRKLYHGDCMDMLPSMPDEYVDIVVTSPPYNMGLVPGGNGRGMYKPGASNKAGRFRDGYGAHDDAMPYDEYCAWQRRVLAECWRVARLGVFYNHRPRVEHGLLRDPLDGDYGGLPLRQRIIINRFTGVDVNRRQFCTRGEYLLLFAKPAFALVDDSASGMGDIWPIGIETGAPWHKAPFKVELPARCIAATGAQSVLDPFVGSGTTLIAARNAGIRGVGIENDEPTCQGAVRRYTGERHRAGTVQMTLEAAS